MKLDLQFILSKAPNRAAADNGKKLSSSPFLKLLPPV